jgi:tRNA-binding protein
MSTSRFALSDLASLICPKILRRRRRKSPSISSSPSIFARAPSCRPNPIKPAFKLVIDFGPVIGEKRSSVQITENYEVTKLVGRKVAAVVNFPPRQIGKFMSEVLTLGFPDAQGHVVLIAPDKDVPNGARLF